MKKLKIALQSNILYIILIILAIIYILIKTVLISYKSNINYDYIYGYITNISIKDDKTIFILNDKEKVRCIYYKNVNNYDILGSYVKVKGNTIDINNTKIPNTFNYKKYLYNNYIYTNFLVDNIEIIKDANIFYKIKNSIYNRIDNYDSSIKPYLNMFILGDKTLLDNDMASIYQNNGIYHLFCISGMHISLLVLLLSKLFKNIKYNKIIICLVLCYFMFLTSFSASVLRVCIFYFLKCIFDYLNISISNIKLLIITCLICLFNNPFIIYNNGFLYSFIISFTIIFEKNKIKGNYFIKIFKISLLSFIVTLPITINLNYKINILSIILNIFYVPYVSLIVFPSIIISFLFKFLSPISIVLINILEKSNYLFNSINLNILIPKISFILIIIYYLVLLIIHKYNNYKYLLINFIIILICIIFPKLDNSYYVYYLDVSQGDSSIIIYPYKKEVIMIDTGGIYNSNYHITNNIITFLNSLGINNIDKLILTHGDYDHMGDAINLVNNFKVKKVIFNCGEYNDLEKELIKVLDKKKIKYYSCIKELNIDKNKFYFLQTKEYDNENDNSNVIYTELNGYKFIFMGDAGIEKEKDILDKYNLSDIDILKVGHHGSKTSSSKNFINEINPKYSLISVGKNNRYGHPNKEVLDNLKDSKIYRTDLDGSIMFKINNKLNIETCSP